MRRIAKPTEPATHPGGIAGRASPEGLSGTRRVPLRRGLREEKWLLGVAFFLVITAAARAQDIRVTASVGADVVGAQDNFQLTVTVSGRDSGDAEAPRLPRFQGFRVVAGPSVSTSFQWINGRSSSSKSFIYVLLPEKEGEFEIDPIDVVVGGKTFRTEPIPVRVTAASNRAPSQPRQRSLDPFSDDEFFSQRSAPAGDEVFVTAELDRTTAYAGQQVTLTYHLYTQVGVTGLQLQESPPLNGFWVEDLQVDPNPSGTRRVVEGREYLEYVIKKQALFPNSPGKLKIAPSTFAVSVRLPGDLFSLMRQAQTVYKKTREVQLTVRPLPEEGRPAQSNTAVGSFSLSSSLDKAEVATGDAVALQVKLSGKGNLKTIPDLDLPPMPDFTIYSSKRTENVRPAEGDAIGGEKLWEYVIVPKAPGLQKIPPFKFSYFDPDRQRYETLSTPQLELRVTRGADSGDLITGLSGITKQSLKRQASDINYIKLSGEDIRPSNEPIFMFSWFYILAGLPVLLNVGAFLYQREKRKESSNVVLARSRRARRTALARLKRAEKAGKENPRHFYDEAALALSGYLTDRYNMPEIAVTSDMLEKSLSAHSVPEENLKEVMACIQECDFGRFVSASDSPAKMREIARRMRRIIDTLERS